LLDSNPNSRGVGTYGSPENSLRIALKQPKGTCNPSLQASSPPTPRAFSLPRALPAKQIPHSLHKTCEKNGVFKNAEKSA
jgi:hypothetical protein